MVISMSYLQDKEQLERQYGAKALKRLLQLSKQLGLPDNAPLVDMKERDFKAYIQRLKVDGIQSSIDGNSEQIR